MVCHTCKDELRQTKFARTTISTLLLENSQIVFSFVTRVDSGLEAKSIVTGCIDKDAIDQEAARERQNRPPSSECSKENHCTRRSRRNDIACSFFSDFQAFNSNGHVQKKLQTIHRACSWLSTARSRGCIARLCLSGEERYHVLLFHHQQQALTVIQTAFQDRDQHIATLQDEFEALALTNYQYVQTLEDRDNTITSLQQQLQDHEIVAKQLADQLEDIKQHDDKHKADHKTIVVLEAGLENLRAKYEKVLEKNHILKQRLEKSEDAVAETEVDKEQVAKWRSECDAARKYVKENKEFKTVNTELRVLLDAATAEQSEDKKQLGIVELVRIKQMYEREIKELRSTVGFTQAATTQSSQHEATEKILNLEAQLRTAQDNARTKIAELEARHHAEQDEITKHAAELEARLETAHNETGKRIVDLEAQLSICRNLPRTTDQDATGKNEGLKKSLATVKSYFSSHHTEDESSQEIIELTRVNQVNEKEIQALKPTVRKLQEGATEHNEPTKWMPEPVADIVLKLEQNLKRIEQ